MTTADIMQRIREFRDARDWMQFHNPKDMAAAIAIEAGELQQEFLWVSADRAYDRAQARRERVSDEIADIAIYLFELADNLGLDLLAAMSDKLDKNDRKYPVEKAKGTAKKYDEL